MSETLARMIPYAVDLGKTIKKTYLDTLFATDDSEAHRFDIILYRDNAKLTIPSGASVSAYFIRYCDDVTIPLSGSVAGNVVSVTLKNACYNKAGQFALIIKVTNGSEISTVFYGEGAIFTSSTDSILDDEHIIPSLSELLAQIDAMEAATSAANTATANANTAAGKANTAADSANKAADTANTAANYANTAAENWDSSYAADSAKLGGKSPAEYASAAEVSQLKNDLADAWTSGKSYAVGDYCISGNRLYKCKTEHTAGSAFDASYWLAESLSNDVKNTRNKVDARLNIYSIIKYVTGSQELSFQSQFTAISENGGGRQPVFLFGMDNGTPVYGMAAIVSNGLVLFYGNQDITGTMNANGRVTLMLPENAYDVFTLLSPHYITT